MSACGNRVPLVESTGTKGHRGSTSHSESTYQTPPSLRISASNTSMHTNTTKLAPYASHPFQSGSLLIQSELEKISALDEYQSAPAPGTPLNTLVEPADLLTGTTEGTQMHPQDGRRFASSSPYHCATSPPPPEAMDIVQLYLTAYDKSRRIFLLSSGQSLVHISKHGFIHKANLSPLRSYT